MGSRGGFVLRWRPATADGKFGATCCWLGQPRITVKCEGVLALEMKATSKRSAASSTRPAAGAPAKGNVAGIAISHPDKLYFPDESITKTEIAAYYERMAPWIVPHTKDRPLAL